MVAKTQITLTPPAPFDFYSTAYSHGWVVLLPNSWDDGGQIVQRVEQLSSGMVVKLAISGQGSVPAPRLKVQVESEGELDKQERAEIRTTVRMMFRLDEDLSEFYELCRARGGFWVQIPNGKGRLLRSPTLFEDVVKTICTTNIQWGGTKRMIENLVNGFGASYPGDPDRHAFPTPETIASVDPEAFAEVVRMGYRAPYVYELAQQIAAGTVDLEDWRDESFPTPELKKKLLAIKGVGNYAAATLLMILGRYDELAVDTVFRQFVSEKYFGGEKVPDAEGIALYADWGKWQYLAYWFDLWVGVEADEL
ncbi:MAG: DNA-3-methyladenine glycosylase 2 family protein [Anaerolineales bacterium]|nr:DNA-3-methyladenine glycosylase 2 family protein [Anaerolineales bacterium]